MSDLRLAKIAAIQRSVGRAREEFAAAGERFEVDLSRQDATLLNILRAYETALDLANDGVEGVRGSGLGDSRKPEAPLAL